MADLYDGFGLCQLNQNQNSEGPRPTRDESVLQSSSSRRREEDQKEDAELLLPTESEPQVRTQEAPMAASTNGVIASEAGPEDDHDSSAWETTSRTGQNTLLSN